MEVKEEFYEHLAKGIIKKLKTRQIEGFYCSTSEEAKTLALSFIKAGDTVSFGGSMTLEECGLISELRNKNDIHLLDRTQCKSAEETKKLYRDAFSSDVYYMSSNAITTDGELVNIDGNGNRVAALIYGPEKVVLVIGMNKIAPTVPDAIARIHNVATPQNCIRLNRSTPCAVTGVCADCLSPDCICNDTAVIRRSGNPDRIKVILVGQSLGY